MSDEKKDEKPKDPCWGYEKSTGIPKLFKDGVIPKDHVDSPAKCDGFNE